MLQYSAAPLALGLVLLASCGGGGSDSSGPAVSGPVGSGPPVADPPQIDDPAPVRLEDVEIVIEPASPTLATQSAEPAGKSTRANRYFLENQSPSWRLVAQLPDGSVLAVSLVESDDMDSFAFDPATGALTLSEAQDYERPGDANGDNVFEIAFELDDYPFLGSMPITFGVNDQKEIFEDYPVVRLTSDTQFGGLGRHMVPLGDIDGDGRPDLAVAAPGRHNRDGYQSSPPQGYHPAGDAYVVSGSVLSDTTLVQLHDFSASGLWHLAGTSDTLNLGYNMTAISDLDGDLQNEFLVASSESTLEIISGATLVARLNAGGTSELSDLESGTLTLPDNQRIDPLTMTEIGDLDGDTLSEIVFCAHQIRGSRDVESQIFVVSGSALRASMLNASPVPIVDFYDQAQAGYQVYRGSHLNCGPLTALGDVDDDGLTDVAIPMPGPLVGDSGVLVYSGARLREVLLAGGRHALSAYDKFFGAKESFVHMTDPAAKGGEQHYMVTALGDVTGDGIDDFGFSWQRYHGANDSAYIVKGDRSLLSAQGESLNIREMVPPGGAIQLAASPDGLVENVSRVEPVHVLHAPEGDPLHSTLIFVGVKETSGEFMRSYSVAADQLPTAGTSIVSLPVGASGLFVFPKGNGRQLARLTSIGDLNLDGYGDLAIGWGIADLNRVEDSGGVLLVSGKEIIDWRDRGETFRPADFLPLQ